MRTGLRRLCCALLAASGCVDAAATDDPLAPGGGKADGAPAILLDCNTSLGPDQQVTVVTDGERYALRELTTSGSQIERPLAEDEWLGQVLRLRDDGWGSTSTLTKEDGDWVTRSSGGGFTEIGLADCWVDESP